jgi:Calcineurin-like phosphoesterase
MRVFTLKHSKGRILLTAIALIIFTAGTLVLIDNAFQQFMNPSLTLLTDPFLQLPTINSVRVVWFTEFQGERHIVEYGANFGQRAIATTTKLSRVREDQKSRVGNQTEDGQVYAKPTLRNIWRHEAEVTGLSPDIPLPYRVVSTPEAGRSITSGAFTLAPLPRSGKPLKILLTSDHQQKPMTPANLQKVVETVGAVDAIFFAGDLVDVADRASEWFDSNQGNSFFPGLQGRAHFQLERAGVKTMYTGGALMQTAPLFPAIGNHEVMGRFSAEKGLADQFNDPIPKQIAAQLYAQKASQLNPQNEATIREDWLKNNSFNTDTYEEIFTLPETSSGGKKYYALTFGDIRLIALYVTNIWRTPNLGAAAKGRFRERDEDLENPERWGYGQHIFEPIAKGSPQYNWLQGELRSPEFQRAKYKIVMFHHPPHDLGDNIVPAYTDPVQIIDRSPNGQIQSVRYEYPLESDYLVRDLIPLLESAGVQLVFYGHSHIWNRFVSPTGMHFLQSSNVGNTYGAFVGKKRRAVPLGFDQTYVATGNPNGLEPVMPAIAPLNDDQGNPLPYIASNEITAFSILETGTATVSSYYFDTRKPKSQVVKFDEFQIR